VQTSDRSLMPYPADGFVAGIPMFFALATQATAWNSASHVAKGSTPRPLELPGGSTG
jgi:hypothetical protein